MASYDQYNDTIPTGSSNGRPIPITGLSTVSANILHNVGVSSTDKLWIYASNKGPTTASLTLNIDDISEDIDISKNDRRNILGPDEIFKYGITISAHAAAGGSFVVHIRTKGHTSISTI